MNNGEKVLTQQKILLFAATIAVVALVLAIILPRIINSEVISLPTIPPPPRTEAVTTDLPSSTENGTEVGQAPPSAVVSTPVFFTPPIIGTIGFNLPNEFRVENWRNNSCEANSNPYFVELYGVEIRDGISSCSFNFMTETEEITAFEATSNTGYFEFPNVVRIPRNVYIQVIIMFQSKGGKSEWIDHIKYLDKTSCTEE